MHDWRQLVSLTGTIPSMGIPIPHPSGSGHFTGAQDSLFVLSSVASSLAGGLFSLVLNPKPSSGSGTTSFGLPDTVFQSLFQSQQNVWHQSDYIDSVPGSQPSDYDVVQPESSSRRSNYKSNNSKPLE